MGRRLDIGWVFDRRKTAAPTALDPPSRDDFDLLASADSGVLCNVGDALATGHLVSAAFRQFPPNFPGCVDPTEKPHPSVPTRAPDANAFPQLLVDPKCGKIFLLCRLEFPPKVKSFFLIRFAANLGAYGRPTGR